MAYEVRIYDGKGKLKRTVQPVFDYDAVASIGRTTLRECVMCKTKTQLKGTQRYCSETCAKKYKAIKERARRTGRNLDFAAKPVVPCEICGKPVPRPRSKYCKKECDGIARKLKNMNDRQRTKEKIKIKREELRASTTRNR